MRDEFESKIPELETRLSKVMGIPWHVKVDVPATYAHAEDRGAKENPGQMLYKYVNPPGCPPVTY